MNLQKLIWVLCFLIFFQVGWIFFRLGKLEQRKKMTAEEQNQKQEQEENAIKKDLLAVPEPAITGNQKSGAKLWLKPDTAVFNKDFELEVWGYSDEPLEKIDLRLFYSNDYLELADNDWEKESNGTAYWTTDFNEDGKNDFKTKESFLIRKIAFKINEAAIKGVVETGVDFDFTKDSRLDCNLWNFQEDDLLTETQGAKINLKIIYE